MRRSRTHLLGHALWIVSAVVIAAVTVTPVAEPPIAEELGKLCIVCGEFGIVDVLWNFMLFIPLGFGLAIAGVRASRAVLSMFAGTVIIELLQITAVAGRDASLGDVIWNSIGGITGWALGTRVDSLLYPQRRSSLALALCSLGVWLSACLIAPWALQRDPTESEYVGQLGRALGGFLPYPGHVVSAAVGDLTIPNDVIQHSSDVRRALLDPDGADIEARVVPAAPTDWDASLVRTVDHRRREIFEVSALGNDLLFAFRTHASRLRLRAMHFRLPRAFAENGRNPRADTVLITARYAEDRVELRTTSPGGTTQTRIPLTASSGWRLIAPVPVETEGSLRDALLNAGWLFVLVTPVSYWMSFVASFVQRRMMLVVVVATLCAGLAAGPYAFHIAPPSVADFGGILAGLATGPGLAVLVKRRLTVGAAESS